MVTILFVLPVRMFSHKENTNWSTECIIDDGHHGQEQKLLLIRTQFSQVL